MPGKVAFQLDIETAKSVRAFLDLREAEKKAEQGLADIAKSAERSGAVATSAARKTAREYELAERQMARAIPSPRSLGGAYFARGRNVAPLDLSALPSSRLRPGAASIAATALDYALPRDEDEQFRRYLRAQSLRGQRRTEQLYARQSGVAAANLGNIDQVLGYGQSILDRGFARSSGRAGLNLGTMDRLLARGEQMMNDSAQRQETERERQLSNVEIAAAKQRQVHEKLWNGLTQGLTVAAGAVAAVSAATERYTQMLDRAGAAGAALERDLTPLLSIGDNAGRVGQVRAQALSLSGAYGLEAGQIGAMQYMLQSVAGNLGPAMQGQIFNSAVGLNKTIGGDLQSEAVAITKLMETFGGGMRGNPDVAASKLLTATNLGSMTPEEMATLLPDVLPAAKLGGKNQDEALAAITVGSNSLGRNEKTFTGARNFFLELNKAVQEGQVPRGTLIEQLKFIQHVDPLTLQRMFGERTISFVAALAEHVADVARNIKTIESVAGSEVLAKFVQRNADATSRDAAVSTSAAQQLKNVDAIRFQDPDLRKRANLIAFARLGWESTASPMLQAITPEWSKNLYFAGQANAAVNLGAGGHLYPGKDIIDKGLFDTIAAYRNAGDPQSQYLANLLTYQYGGETNTSINGHLTDDATAQDYANFMRSTHGRGRRKDFEEVESARARGDQTATRILMNGFIREATEAAKALNAAAQNQHAASAAPRPRNTNAN